VEELSSGYLMRCVEICNSRHLDCPRPVCDSLWLGNFFFQLVTMLQAVLLQVIGTRFPILAGSAKRGIATPQQLDQWRLFGMHLRKSAGLRGAQSGGLRHPVTTTAPSDFGVLRILPNSGKHHWPEDIKGHWCVRLFSKPTYHIHYIS
jgi:hypothetical protein